MAVPKLLVFDLDGTLVDSLRDIANAVNHALALLGLPTHPVDAYRYMVGEGVPKLCERAIGDSHPQLVPRLIELTRARYRMNLLEHTRPYAGVAELVDALGALPTQLAVLSNKPHALTQRVVAAYWRADVFAQVQGYELEALRKPDPTLFLRLCERAGVQAEEACMIGDTPTDVHTAHNAGAQAIAVLWGFRRRAELEAAGATEFAETPDALRRRWADGSG